MSDACYALDAQGDEKLCICSTGQKQLTPLVLSQGQHWLMVCVLQIQMSIHFRAKQEICQSFCLDAHIVSL